MTTTTTTCHRCGGRRYRYEQWGTAYQTIECECQKATPPDSGNLGMGPDDPEQFDEATGPMPLDAALRKSVEAPRATPDELRAETNRMLQDAHYVICAAADVVFWATVKGTDPRERARGVVACAAKLLSRAELVARMGGMP